MVLCKGVSLLIRERKSDSSKIGSVCVACTLLKKNFNQISYIMIL